MDASAPDSAVDSSPDPVKTPVCGDGRADPGEFCGWDTGVPHGGEGRLALITSMRGADHFELLFVTNWLELELRGSDGEGFTELGPMGWGRVAAGELDADGKDELVVMGIDEILVHQFDDSNTMFTTRHSFPGVTPVHAVAIGDIDGDGNQDLIIASGTDVRVAYNNGQASFVLGPPVPFAYTQDHHSELSAADVTGDQRSDVIVKLWDKGMQLHLLPATETGLGDARVIASGALDYTLASVTGQVRVLALEPSQTGVSLTCHRVQNAQSLQLESTTGFTGASQTWWRFGTRQTGANDPEGDGTDDILLQGGYTAGW